MMTNAEQELARIQKLAAALAPLTRSEPLDLEAIAGRHRPVGLRNCCLCGSVLPCDAQRLLAEVRRQEDALTERNALRAELDELREERTDLIKEFGQFKEETRTERSEHLIELAELRGREQAAMSVIDPVAQAARCHRCPNGPGLVPWTAVLAARAWRDREQGGQR